MESDEDHQERDMKLLKPRTILLGGLAVAAVAGALKNRDKVAGLIGVRSSAPEPWTPTTPPAPPPPHNADLPREDAGTPAPPTTSVSEPAAAQSVADEASAAAAVDEAEEEAAAGAEAAAIGGATPSYAGIEAGQPASEADRPVLEGGGGEAEGLEQAEADLLSNVETSIGEPQPGYVSISDAIQAEDSPGRWEQVEPLASRDPETTEPGSETRQSASHPMLETDPAGEAAIEPSAADEAAEAAITGTPEESIDEGASDIEAPPEDSGISSAPSWGERFRARVRERDEARAREDSGATSEPEPQAEGEATETPAEEKSSAVWQREAAPKPPDAIEEPPASLLASDEQPTVEADSLKPEPSGSDDDDEGSEWQTWSGRAIEP